MVKDDMLAPWEPTATDPFDLKKTGHLLRRAAFGGSLAEREELAGLGVVTAIDRLFEKGKGDDVDSVFEDALALEEDSAIRSYRFWRLLCGPERLRERMSFFWHCHFATSNQKVKNARMMARQLQIFDTNGLGQFDDLVLAISRDPAMIRWLDNDSNVKGKANENYARELFELFALGRGNYTEADIKQAARAFTGWHLSGERFVFRRRLHDSGKKTVFGKSGRFGGEDIVSMTVRRPESAQFICRKLLRFFVHPEPTREEVNALAAVYRKNGRHLGKTVKVLLRSRLFFSARAWRSRIKSPADLVVGLVRIAGGRAAPNSLARAAGKLGQTLLEPPSVEGWHEERAWISSASWLLRTNFAGRLFQGWYHFRPGADKLLEGARTAKQRADLGIRILLDGELSDASRDKIRTIAKGAACQGSGGAATLLHAIQSLPEGQML